MEAAILIVDDNQSNLDTLKFLIDDIKFDHDVQVTVYESSNGNDALSLALKRDYALIILDIQMPDMDGFEVAKYLKKTSKTKNIPIAFLTAAFKSEDMRKYGLHLGAVDYFLKPIDPLILIPKIQLYVDFYVITKELKNNNIILEEKIKEAVEKNREMENKLFQSEKLSAMGEMIGNIAHQWRQPLSVISTSATGVKVQKEYGMLTDELLNESMDTISKTTQYLSNTIDDFKNFVKGDSGSKVQFNLSEDIKRCLEIEHAVLKRYNIEVILNLDDSIFIEGFPNSLIQVFINIINNSKDVMVEKTEESVRFIFITTKQSDNNIFISINDNGGGIDDDIKEKIFEPYFTTKHQSQGTGLGLHMSFQIIKDAMSGTIDVDNEEYTYNNKQCKGALFTIKLPKKNKE
ncbi:MAG: hybrid sensor histidine kinase/response regulator [Campylobacterota bacterium]|nr:hybrid sensor histidine kinase/response regulator [Campylobacterota bacterium]